MEHLRQYATDVNRERPNSMQQVSCLNYVILDTLFSIAK